MKKIVLLLSVLLLGACSANDQSVTNQTASSHQETSSTKELKFVVAPQYEGQTSDLIELGKKLTQEYPEIGDSGSISIYYVGATYRVNGVDHAVFMFINRTDLNLDRDAEFNINWSYDGNSVYNNQTVEYKISEHGILPSNAATILLLPIDEKQKEVVDQMTVEDKMKLEISDIQMKRTAN